MILRFFSFAACQLLGAGAGWLLGREPGALVGMALGALLWFVLDLAQGMRVLQLLRRDHLSTAPLPGGLWGEVANRMRRLLRNREQISQEAQSRLQDFLAAIQESPNGVVLLDAKGHIEWCNQTAARHFGFDAERDLMQLIGNLVRDPVFAAYYAQPDSAREVIIAGRESLPSRPVRLAVHLHGYGAGRRMLLSRDVTAVEQAEAMRRDFVANVSHEIRTPLTVLAGFVETLQNLPLEAHERGRYLGLMATQSHRMQTLVSDLLTLSKLEGSPPPGMDDWVRVPTLLTQCEADGRALSALLANPPHSLQVETGPDCEIAGIHTELLSAMFNLLSNAIRYTPPGEAIVVRWAPLTDGRFEFSVQDAGPGIAPEHLPRLTERFYRVDRSRSRETGGTGLGLAIVKHVVQRHGGELRIQSTPGKGSTFVMVFPASRVRLLPASAVAQAGRALTV
ncbi:MAG: phosphate regulon sensor histidine kinase PhoR [Pseudomonadota bacterium]